MSQEGECVIIRVHYTDSANQKIEQQVDLPEEATIRELLDRMGNSFAKMMVVINGQVVRMDALLEEDSEVYLFSPMAGG